MDIKKFKAWAESKKLSTDGETGRNYSYTFYDPKTQAAWDAWKEAKAQVVLDLGELQERIAGHQYYHNEHGHMIVDMDDVVKEISGFDSHKAQAMPEGRTDSEIIDQTIQLVDLLASANRFQRDKSKPFPFESKNPRNMEWWRLACQIQELITDTDPNNCDFEEYKAMIETQGLTND